MEVEATPDISKELSSFSERLELLPSAAEPCQDLPTDEKS
jgi:hypothetical protein